MADLPFPKANKHGELRELFDGVFFVSGGVRMAPGMSFSRNMTVVREGTDLTLINSMRLDDEGLAALDALGDIKHVIRLAGFHGMDDRFYKDRNDATIWNVEGQVYAKGFDAAKANPTVYFEADETINGDSELPISGASLHHFKSAKAGEGLVVLDREGGVVVSGDCLQNWHKTDAYFSLLARPTMKLMGFLKAHNVGPGWLKAAKPDIAEVTAILDIPFEHVLPAHGEEVVGNAKELYRPAIERLAP